MPLESAQICGHCLHSPPIQEHSFSLLRYQAAVPRCITRFKFHQQLQFADFFAEHMAKQLQQRHDLPACLIPIPLHPRRLRSRGFNQSLEVATRLARKLGIRCRPELLQRVRNTPSQSQLHYRQRQRNIRHAFASTALSLPTHIALLDDVMTTGQTVAEAARILQAGGVQIIEVWTIARAISHY
jgi:ComF family protein